MYLVDGITKQKKGVISEDFETVIWLYIFFVEYIFQSKITVEKNWKFFLVIILFVVLALLFWLCWPLWNKTNEYLWHATSSFSSTMENLHSC